MIKIAVDVIRAVLLAIGIPKVGLTNDNVENTTEELHPIICSEMTQKHFVLI